MAKFEKGRSGNPAGRPRGIEDRRTRLRRLIESRLPELVDRVIAAALDGDMTASKMLLDRTIPAMRPRGETLPSHQRDVSDFCSSNGIVEAMANGRITPTEASEAIGVLWAQARLDQAEEIRERLERLEKRLLPGGAKT
jgi:hypothetical protein